MVRTVRKPDEPPVRDQIVAAASSVFSSRGYASSSLKSIAARANITPAGIYYHFENKQALLFECLRLAIIGLTDACKREVERRATPQDRLRAYVKTHITYQLEEISDVTAVYTRWVYSGKIERSKVGEQERQTLRSLEVLHYHNLKRILLEGALAGRFDVQDASLTAFAIIGMCEHVLTWAKKSGRLTGAEIGERFADYALRMVRARAGSTS